MFIISSCIQNMNAWIFIPLLGSRFLFLDAILFDRGKPLDQTCNVLPRTLCALFSKMASVNSTKSVGKIITPKTERSEMFQPQNLLYYLLKLEVINVSGSLTELWGVCIKFEQKSDSKTFNRSCGVGGSKEQSTRRSIAGSRLLLKSLYNNNTNAPQNKNKSQIF